MASLADLVWRAPLRVAWPLDPGAFRLFLAMLVFVHHFSSLALGGYAVYVFFVLSGFWLQKMWTERYARTHNPYLTYMVSRIWRLAPVMIVVSLITLTLLPLIGIPSRQIYASNPLHLALSSALLLGYSSLDYLPVGSAWSLDIEMQFYLLAPLLAVLAGAGWGRVLLVLALAGSLVSSQLVETVFLPKYLGFFVLGMTAARLDWRPSGRLAGWSAGIFAAAVVGVFLSPWRDILIGGATPGPLHVWSPHYNVVLALISIPFAIYTTGRKSDEIDRMLADLSYIIYLLHWVAMQWFFRVDGPFAERLAVAAASFALVPIGSWLIWRTLDRPLNVARARWVASRVGTNRAAALSEPAAP